MTHEEFVEDWKNRYIKDVCTKDHLLRLQRIGRLSAEEVQMIINAKIIFDQENNKQ